MLKHYRVAIIDSGLNIEHIGLKDVKCIHSYEVTETQDDIFAMRESSNDSVGHGTAICSIIKKVANPNFIITIKIIDDVEESNARKLIYALKWINENIDVDIINMSLGVGIYSEKEELLNLCNHLKNKGTILVSAFDDNLGALTSPGIFSGVIGVLNGEYFCFCPTDFEFFANDIVSNIGGFGRLQRLPWKGNDEYRNVSGSSFACAYVTAQISKFIDEGINDFDEIIKKFREIAIAEHNSEYKQNEIKKPEIQKAALFPFSKENQSFLRFYDCLDFQIVEIYDTKYSGLVGKNTIEVMKNSDVLNKTIQDIKKINWEEIDTLILGHLGFLKKIIRNDKLVSDIINEATKNDVLVYSYDDISQYCSSEDKVYYPQITTGSLPPFRYEKLFEVGTPAIGVWGTSSKQGKFTLQMELRKRFKKDGYNVGQIGTEPSSLLYGMDYVLPIGFNRKYSVLISDFDVVRYLNSAMADLDSKNKDIIIVGSQAGTVSKYDYTLYEDYLFQYFFLLGTRPDVIILCVNYTDEMSYIKRTIQFLESSSEDCKVIALALFPIKYLISVENGFEGTRKLFKSEIDEFKEKTKNIFCLDVYTIGEKKELDALYEKAIDYFAKEN